ncbi:hypothetical protein [Streptomyces noursei]|uniref:hypothetical protein n=1 Tax=Streptomyces noursei TaxID=1971 RepID=UPI0035DD987C
MTGPFEEPSVQNDASDPVNEPVGQFGTVYGDIHMHCPGYTSEIEHEDAGDDGAEEEGTGLLRATGFRGPLALASTTTERETWEED